MFRRVVGPLCILALFSGACGGSGTEPTRTTTSATAGIADPVAGTTLAKETPFKITFPVRFAQDAFTLYTVAFVRDDGLYSPPVDCGGGGSSGGAFADTTVEVSGILNMDRDRIGRTLYEFAKGHRVNAVLLLKRVPDASSGGPGCAPLGTFVPGPFGPFEGTVFPAVADQRVDMSLNWLIQE